MMEQLRQYVISVTAAAFLCGILLSLLPKGSAREFVKLGCGFLLALTVLRPLSRLEIRDLTDLGIWFSGDAEQASALGECYSQKQLRSIIKEETQAYILNKAEALGAELSVEVTLSPDAVPVPVAAQLTGTVSPYARSRLENILHDDLGIAKENQLWTQ